MSASASPSRRVILIEVMGDASNATASMSSLSANIDKLVKEMGRLTGSMRGHGTQVQKHTENVKKESTENKKLLSTMVLVTAAYYSLKKSIMGTVMAGDDLNKFLNMSRSMFRNAKTDVDGLTKSFLGMGKNAKHLLEAASGMAQVGVKGHDNLKKASMAAHDLSYIMGESMGTMSKQLSDFSRTLGLPDDKIENLASSMAALRVEFGASNEALGSISKEALVVARELKIPADALLSMSATFEKAGARGAEAGSMVSSLITRMGGPELGNVLKRVGIDAQSMQDQLARGDSASAMMELSRAFKGAGETAILEFGRMANLSGEQIAVIANLEGMGDVAKNAMGTAGKAFKDSSILSKMFGIATADLGSQLHLLWEQFEAIGQEIGTFLAPLLIPFIGAFKALVYLINIMPGPLKALVGGIGFLAVGLLGAAVGMSKFFTSTMVASVATKGLNALIFVLNAGLRGTIRQLALMASVHILSAISVTRNTIALLLNTNAVKGSAFATYILTAANSALIGVVRILDMYRARGLVATLLYMKATAMQAASTIVLAIANSSLITSIVGATAAQWLLNAAMYANPIGLIVGLVVALAAAMYGLYYIITESDVWKVLTISLGAFWDGLKKLFAFTDSKGGSLFGDFGKSVIKFAETLAWVIPLFFDSLLLGLQPLKPVISSIMKSLSDAYHAISSLFSSADSGANKTGSNISDLSTTIQDLAMLLGHMVAVVVKGLVFAVYLVVEAVKGWILIFQGLWWVCVLVYDILKTVIVALFNFGAFIGNTVVSFVSLLISMGTAVTGFFQGVVAAIWDLAYGIVSTVLKLFFNLGAAIGNSIVYLVELVMSVGSNMIGFIGSVLSTVWSLLSPFNSISEKFDIIKGFIAGVWETICNGATDALSAITGFVNSVLAKFDILPDFVKKRLFGSGLFHIVEGAQEAEGSIVHLANSFTAITDGVSGIQAAFRSFVDELKQLPQLMRDIAMESSFAINPELRIATAGASPVSSVVSRAASGAIRAQSNAPAIATAGSQGGATTANITVPVTLTLDGEMIARATAQLTAVDLIRHHNTPELSYRGVPEM